MFLTFALCLVRCVTRRAFVLTFVGVLALVSPTETQFAFAASTRPPNVVVILTDDQGWGDLSASGNTNLVTPNIDSLAHDGATMENFYVCQVCAPTRAEFLTGRYYPRTGVSGVSRGEGRLNPDETTIADIFKAAGYATGAFGKWHNGTQPPYHPNNRGFDEYYGFTSGHWGHYFSPPLDHNGQRVRGKGFVVDDFTDHALTFIEENHKQDRPFFCYVPLNTPHSPMMVPDRFYAKFDGKNLSMLHRDPKKEYIMMTRAALAMCENIDWNVGRILKKLDDLKLRENTLVIYFSDNGPNSFRWNGDMKGKKGSIDEGGLRSPFFIRWPGQIREGAKISTIAGAIDLLPTLTDLAGIDLAEIDLAETDLAETDLAETDAEVEKPLDGRSLRSLLLKPEQSDDVEWEPRSLFATKKNQVSVRTQRFRLDASGKLFDIEVDRGQNTDVARHHPDIAARLILQAKRHAKEMKTLFETHANRPFTVGYGESTSLMARDGVEHGTIQRSARYPNNSFFTHWTRAEDSITWDIEVGKPGEYGATVYYTCDKGDEGTTLQLSMQSADTSETKIRTKVLEVFDPPFYDRSKERISKSHYQVKDFKPLRLGTIRLSKGRGTLRLSAIDIKGKQVIDVHSLVLSHLDWHSEKR